MSRHSQLVSKLYEDRNETGDVTFIVDSERIRAHRCVLAAFSPKYKAQLYDTELDKENIEVNGVTVAAFNEFLGFFYFNDVKLTIENVEAVLDLAKQSLVEDFVKETTDFLTQNVTVDNVCSVYRLANLHDIKELKNLCERIIGNNTKELFKQGTPTDDFLQCNHATLMQILDLESIACTEIEIFDACMAWARAACEQQNIDVEKPENLRAVLGDAIYKVRFVSLTLEDFVVRYKSIEGFFTSDEFNEITYMIGKLKDFRSEKFIHLPRGLCANLVQSEFECNRIVSVRKELEDNPYKDPLVITCSEPIFLVGFALNSMWVIKEADDFIITNAINKRVKPNYTLKYTNSMNAAETIVILKKPFSFNSGSIRIEMPRLRLDADLKFILKNRVAVEGVIFEFMGNFPMITRLFFNKTLPKLA